MNKKHTAHTETIWKDTRLGEIGRIVAGGTPSTSNPDNWNGPVAWITPADLSGLTSRYLLTTERTLTKLGLAASAAHLVPPRSLVISSRAPIGHMALPLVSFCTNQGCKTIEFFDGQDPDFHYYNLRFWVRRLHDKGEGTTFSEISKKALEAVEVPVPSNRKVQETIASVLSLLDRAIEQTEALLAKQQRIKTGLMHDLLTRGLDAQGRLRDPSTHPFKESPLGLIPEDWEVNPLRHYLKFISYGFTNPMPETPDGPFMVTAANINNGVIDFSSCRHTAENAFRKLLTGKSRPLRNDILLTKDGSLGRLAIAGGEIVCINQSVAILRVNERIEAGFLKRLLEAEKYQGLMLADAGGSTIKHLYITGVETLLIAIPQSPEERVRIENILRVQDLAVDRLRAEEHKLRRLKAGLMHDLLTGRVPVTPLLANPKAPI